MSKVDFLWGLAEVMKNLSNSYTADTRKILGPSDVNNGIHIKIISLLIIIIIIIIRRRRRRRRRIL